jgi:TetR/AcrR family transcriptional regulator, transcriptional repressor for nem operon
VIGFRSTCQIKGSAERAKATLASSTSAKNQAELLTDRKLCGILLDDRPTNEMTRASNATRERLVETARDLFHKQGYTPTGISQILKSSGANGGSLYYFFPTKEDLLMAVLEWYRDHIKDDLIDLHTAHIEDPIEKIFGLLDGYRQMLLLFEFELGCPIGALALELSNTHSNVRGLLVTNFEQWIDVVEGFLRQVEDRFPAESDLRALAIHVLTTMEGGMMLAKTYRSTAYFDQSVTQIRDYIDLLLQHGTGWSAPKPAEPLEKTI